MHVLIEQPAPIPDKALNEMILSALQKDSSKRPSTVLSWIEKIVPLLRKSVSNEYGWRLNTLQRELAAPADRNTPTAQL